MSASAPSKITFPNEPLLEEAPLSLPLRGIRTLSLTLQAFEASLSRGLVWIFPNEPLLEEAPYTLAMTPMCLPFGDVAVLLTWSKTGWSSSKSAHVLLELDSPAGLNIYETGPPADACGRGLILKPPTSSSVRSTVIGSSPGSPLNKGLVQHRVSPDGDPICGGTNNSRFVKEVDGPEQQERYTGHGSSLPFFHWLTTLQCGAEEPCPHQPDK
jgi:hypothetical protein